MTYSVRTIYREFTPAEAGEITGVSPTLQRDWRRRGLLPENEGNKWTRWTLPQIIEMSVMKRLSDAGVDVSKTLDAAHIAVLPVLSLFTGIEGAVVFEGDEVSESLRQAICAADSNATRLSDGSAGPNLGSFLFIGREHASDQILTARFHLMADLDDFLADRFFPLFIILDCNTVGWEIYDRAGHAPLIRKEIEASE